MLAITNGRIITDNDVIEGMNVIINNGSILGITESIPQHIEVLDAGGNFVSPGFMDIHIHGAGGCDVMDGTFESINTISKTVIKHGTTSFISSTMTLDASEIKNALKAVKRSMSEGTEGARVIGAHLEGPFLNEAAKGSHSSAYIKKPDIGFFMELLENELEIVRIVTIAPEIEGASELIRFMAGLGITVSIGHSSGSYKEVMDAVGIGASHSTHLYNAMKGLNHRDPGVVGAIFDSRISTEIIADGVHVHFAAIRTALTVKGYKSCALISDAMRACSMEDGTYSLGGQEVHVKNCEARLADGTLAGSTLTLDRAVRNIVKNTSLNMAEAVFMATAVPARICRLSNKKGYIKAGYDADIIIFDSDVNIKVAIIGGKRVFGC